jgi:hypothetical protein
MFLFDLVFNSITVYLVEAILYVVHGTCISTSQVNNLLNMVSSNAFFIWSS